MTGILGLDHVGVAVADLDAAAAVYERLGFRLTPLSRHTRAGVGDGLQPAGTANRCAMLAEGYLELITVDDPTADSHNRRQIAGFLDSHEGGHILAIGCADAAATRACLVAAGLEVGPVRDLRRRIGEAEAGFSLVMPASLETPDSVTFFIQHRTPELLWRPEYLEHPNGARGLVETLVAVADPDIACDLYGRALGAPPEPHGRLRVIRLPRGRFAFGAPADIAAELGLALPRLPLPAIVGVTIAAAADHAPVQASGLLIAFERA